MLDAVRARVDEIEGKSDNDPGSIMPLILMLDRDDIGLHRQNELTIKEPFSVKLGGGGWLFGSSPRVIEVQGLGASFVPAKESEDEEERV